jgi:hypothetical protein
MVPKPTPDRSWEMTEDSGAFKTNPVNSGGIPPFVMIRRTVATKPHRTENGFCSPDTPLSGRFLASAGKPLRYSRIGLIRCAGGVSGIANTALFSGHRVPDGSMAFADLPQR